MRVVVVGAGAMGSLFACHLAGTGEEVWVYDVWREHVWNGRPTEIDCLNGAVIREGGRTGVPTPYNRAVTGLIRVLEATRGRDR